MLCDRAFEWSLNAGETIERVVTRDSPTWSPRFVDQLVGDRIHRELMDFTDKVRRDPDHELRQSADPLPVRVRRRSATRSGDHCQGRCVKEQLMARDEITRAAETAWRPSSGWSWRGSTTRPARCAAGSPTPWCGSVNHCATTPNCATRSTTGSCGRRSIWCRSTASEITSIITETIERWDAEDASRRIELHVGRDLQFIRINGTVVGALAGLVIYTVAQISYF